MTSPETGANPDPKAEQTMSDSLDLEAIVRTGAQIMWSLADQIGSIFTEQGGNPITETPVHYVGVATLSDGVIRFILDDGTAWMLTLENVDLASMRL